MLDALVSCNPGNLSGGVVLSVLLELREQLRRRNLCQKKHTISLLPSQAIALWDLGHNAPPDTYGGNLLLKICNIIHQKYLAQWIQQNNIQHI
jgi:hypothetical protein